MNPWRRHAEAEAAILAPCLVLVVFLALLGMWRGSCTVLTDPHPETWGPQEWRP